jgi:hypothetical protein
MSRKQPDPPKRPSRVHSNSFDYSLDFKKIDFRKRPDLYRIGRGEQGVLLVEPYKSEILPHWRFADAEKAQASSEKIYALFLEYLKQKILSGPIWHASFYKWVIPAPGVMPIIKVAKNTMGQFQMIKRV